jgi:hypothetical protein
MSLISVLISLAIAGVALWLINSYLPMDKKIKKILNVVVVVIVILWLMSAFGVFGSHHSSMRLGSLHMWW